MQTFKDFTTPQVEVTESDIEAAKKRISKMKKGSSVSFTHHQHGKVTGKYGGMGRMGGRSYAKVHTDKELHYVPPHQIHEETITEASSNYNIRGFKDPITAIKSADKHAQQYLKQLNATAKAHMRNLGPGTTWTDAEEYARFMLSLKRIVDND